MIVTVLKEVVTVIFLNEDIRERIILIYFIVCVQKGISDSVPVSEKQVVSLRASYACNINITLQIIY